MRFAKPSFKKAKGSKKIGVPKAGEATAIKGLKKGKTYKVTVKVTAAGDASYMPLTKRLEVPEPALGKSAVPDGETSNPLWGNP